MLLALSISFPRDLFMMRLYKHVLDLRFSVRSGPQQFADFTFERSSVTVLRCHVYRRFFTGNLLFVIRISYLMPEKFDLVEINTVRITLCQQRRCISNYRALANVH